MNLIVKNFYDFIESSSEIKNLTNEFFISYVKILQKELLEFNDNEEIKNSVSKSDITDAKESYQDFMKLERTPLNAFSFILQALRDRNIHEYENIKGFLTIREYIYNENLAILLNNNDFIMNVFYFMVEVLNNFESINGGNSLSLFFAPFYMEENLNAVETFHKILKSKDIEYYLSQPYGLCLTHRNIMASEIRDFDLERKSDLIDMLEILTKKIQINNLHLILKSTDFIPLTTLPIIKYINALNKHNGRSIKNYENHPYVTQYYDLKYSKIFELFDNDKKLEQFLDFFEFKGGQLLDRAEANDGVSKYSLICYNKDELIPFPYEKIKNEWDFNMPCDWNIELLDL